MSAAPEKRLDWGTRIGPADAEELYLVLHGLDASPGRVGGLCETIAGASPSAHILVPQLPLEWWRAASLSELGEEILEFLADDLEMSRYQHVRIVGHSAGGVLAQAVFLAARTERPEHPLNAFTGNRLRLILIAPINHGWEVTHHQPLAEKVIWTLGSWAMPLFTLYHWVLAAVSRRRYESLVVKQLRRGSPYLVWMRLTWLDLQGRSGWAEEAPEVIELLGSIDEVVSWRDMVDTVVGGDFVYFEVPHSNHVGIVELDHPEYGQQRAEAFGNALKPFDAARLSPFSVIPWDDEPAPPDKTVQRVVFVIHGIRDEGHWTQKIASRARRHYALAGLSDRGQIAVETSSYGFFSMLEFLLTTQRMRKIHWLVDRYAEARRKYPQASFSYVGHSNGTFLAAHALRIYPKMRFERVAFAGSVVSSYFEWQPLAARGQVEQVLNFTATADWVVGILPRISDILPWKLPFGADIGGAGVMPFTERGDVVVNKNYRTGAHSAAIVEDNWDTLARFAVASAPHPAGIPTDPPDYAPKPRWWLNGLPGQILPVMLWPLILAFSILLLPRLAWASPMYLWLLPAGIVLFATIAATWLRTGAPTGSNAERRRLLGQSARLLQRSLLLIAGLLLVGALVNPLFHVLDHSAPEWLRTLSVVGYIGFVYYVLTRV